MLLSNAFSNRLDDLVDTFDKEDIISRRPTRNATSPRLLGIGRNKVVGHFQREKGIEDVNRDLFKVCFLD